MGKVIIRRPVNEDTDHLHSFFETVIRDAFRKEGLGEWTADIEEEIAAKHKALQADLDTGGEAGTFFIAMDGERIRGTIEIGPVSGLVLSCTQGKLQGMTEVKSVLVHPEVQGRGLGSLMWSVAGIAMAGRGITDFCLDSGYREAQRVWTHKFGPPDYVMKDYWGSGNSHMIWTRPVSRIKIRFTL
ncbi:GNAT family N-acetyltransferase [Paenibacillus sp. HN-1]|uniref:GNAT family N-acetyltransferase n=1 Tax=Paenibacillus TaxID=44249 RepID=UPI001CA7CE06|nr:MULTISPECIES: GNAT family N-acetyltransferase [Paenibacillus]MBY9078468.1 GNAT family N-acetyltransferase [Paenibacillus sp. CGMCC 1.18879]MBY9082761.1 GNAT family N-acetyltransferase [Paenibacillus sinensis]